MVENDSLLPDESEREEICEKIREGLDGTKDVGALRSKGALLPKLEKLVALGSLLAGQRERDVITSCVIECLKAGATREEALEVLRQAIMMAEISAETYTRVVHEAINSFENQC